LVFSFNAGMPQSHTLTSGYFANRPGRTKVPARTKNLIYLNIRYCAAKPMWF